MSQHFRIARSVSERSIFTEASFFVRVRGTLWDAYWWYRLDDQFDVRLNPDTNELMFLEDAAADRWDAYVFLYDHMDMNEEFDDSIYTENKWWTDRGWPNDKWPLTGKSE